MLKLRGNVWKLAANKDGSYLLQHVLVHAPACHKVALAAELREHVNEAAWQEPQVARHANHVLQKLIEVMPPENCLFVRDELLRVDDIRAVAHNTYGCRVLQRLIEHFQPADVKGLVDRLLEKETLSKLITSQFGNYVLQCILEHGEQEWKRRIAMALLDDFRVVVVNKFGSHVVESALTFCEEIEKQELSSRIAALDSNVDKNFFGSFVKKAERQKRSGKKPKDHQDPASGK